MKAAFLVLSVLLLFGPASAKPLDSLRLERLQGKPFIIHRVSKGEGLFAIARRYGVDVKAIIAANPSGSTRLVIGEELRIPIGIDTAGTPLGVAKAEIRKKEQVAKVEETSPDIGLAHANADAREMDRPVKHVVVANETVSRIAQRYGITQQELIKWNGIRDMIIEPGQELIVDGSAVRKPYEAWNKLHPSTAKSTAAFIEPPNTVEQTGFAITGGGLVRHPAAAAGTLLLITNLDNGKQAYARVAGNTTATGEVILELDEATRKKLDASGNLVRISILYTLPL